MAQIKVIIERAEDNYSAYVEEVDGIVVTGDTIAEIKRNITEAIDLFIETCLEYGYEIPEQLKGEYSLSFSMDAQTLLLYYDGVFGKPALERITGINRKQLWHYAMGKSKPRPTQQRKIIEGMHNLGEELQLLSL